MKKLSTIFYLSIIFTMYYTSIYASQVIFDEQFNNLNNWNVTISGNAQNCTYDLSNGLTVTDFQNITYYQPSDPNTTSSELRLIQSFEAINAFTLQWSISWDSGSNPTIISQSLRVKIGNLPNLAYYDWAAMSNVRDQLIEYQGGYYNFDQQPAAGSAELKITRTDDTVKYYWNDTLLTTLTGYDDPVSSIMIVFDTYAINFSGQNTDFGTETLSNILLQDDSPQVIPEPTSLLLLIFSGTTILIRKHVK